jgi:hypothetical protein
MIHQLAAYRLSPVSTKLPVRRDAADVLWTGMAEVWLTSAPLMSAGQSS